MKAVGDHEKPAAGSDGSDIKKYGPAVNKMWLVQVVQAYPKKLPLWMLKTSANAHHTSFNALAPGPPNRVTKAIHVHTLDESFGHGNVLLLDALVLQPQILGETKAVVTPGEDLVQKKKSTIKKSFAVCA